MPYWYYTKDKLKNSPSKKNGIPFDKECKMRYEACRYIFDLGSQLDVSTSSNATAIVYLHRFYMFHSLEKFDKHIVATSCLFLAGKVEETPKKCRDLLRVAKDLVSNEIWKAFGDNPREKVMTTERIILQTIKFDLQVEHPYKYLVKFAKAIVADKSKIEKIVEMAWTFINDNFCTTLCIECEPDIIAMAMLYLSCRLSKFTPDHIKNKSVSQHEKHEWWELLVSDVSKSTIEEICHNVLDIYQCDK
ncbi:Cyclin-related protein FAM58A [Intoshia linei]|uniref:Cyclin-related protein FAM58A n=1 Tax=Intoshia linei TaxID=1819745 RepID=A0A177ATV7_9BILA|nr:Cyclin-related protein FAM58A [Intoshia linei]